MNLNEDSADFGKVQLHKLNSLVYDNILSMTHCTGGKLDIEIYPEIGED
jgi:hypothetical protein